jgi:hypothetical protein
MQCLRNDFLAYSPCIEIIEWAYDIMLLSVCLCLRVCVCVSPLSLLSNGSVKISLSLLGNNSVETLPR